MSERHDWQQNGGTARVRHVLGNGVLLVSPDLGCFPKYRGNGRFQVVDRPLLACSVGRGFLHCHEGHSEFRKCRVFHVTFPLYRSDDLLHSRNHAEGSGRRTYPHVHAENGEIAGATGMAGCRDAGFLLLWLGIWITHCVWQLQYAEK